MPVYNGIRGNGGYILRECVCCAGKFFAWQPDYGAVLENSEPVACMHCDTCWSPIAICPKCMHAVFHYARVSDDNKSLKVQINTLSQTLASVEARLKFMRLPIDNHELTSNTALQGDVLIMVQGCIDKPLHAHKYILAAKSPVFRRMFETEMLEKETGIVRIDDATFPVVRAMIEFCYTAEITFNDTVTPDEMIQVAHKYSINHLVDLCEKQMISTLDEVNLAKRLKVAGKLDAEKLEKASIMYLKKNFDTMISPVLEELGIRNT